MGTNVVHWIRIKSNNIAWFLMLLVLRHGPNPLYIVVNLNDLLFVENQQATVWPVVLLQ